MRYLIFLKKELMEIVKTYKIFVLPVVFLFFGFTSPLLTKYTPQLLEELSKSMQKGIVIKFPDPTFIDSYAQLFKNLNQVAIIIMILAFMGIVVEEKVKGSAAMILTKRLSRTSFIISKFIASSSLFTVSLALAAIGCIYYTFLLFPSFYHPNLFLAFFLFWIYGLFIISITIFASTISKTHMMAAIIGFAGFILTSASSLIPYVNKYTPGMLSGLSTGILDGSNGTGDIASPLMTTILLTFGFLWGSIAIFKRQEL